MMKLTGMNHICVIEVVAVAMYSFSVSSAYEMKNVSCHNKKVIYFV